MNIYVSKSLILCRDDLGLCSPDDFGDLVERHSFEGLQIPGVRLFANGGQWHLPPKIVCR